MMSTIIRHAVNAWSGKSFTAEDAEVHMTKKDKPFSPQGNAEVRRVKTKIFLVFPLRYPANLCACLRAARRQVLRGKCLLTGLSSCLPVYGNAFLE